MTRPTLIRTTSMRGKLRRVLFPRQVQRDLPTDNVDGCLLPSGSSAICSTLHDGKNAGSAELAFPRICQENLTKISKKVYKYNTLTKLLMAERKTGLERHDEIAALRTELSATPCANKSKIRQIVMAALTLAGALAVEPAIAESTSNFQLNDDGTFELVLEGGKVYDCKKEIRAVIDEANRRNGSFSLNPLKKMIVVSKEKVKVEYGDCEWHNTLSQQEIEIAALDKELMAFSDELKRQYGWRITEQGRDLIIVDSSGRIMGKSVFKDGKWGWDMSGADEVIAKSEKNIAKSEKNIAKSEKNIAKSEKNIAESQARIDAIWQRILEHAIANSGKSS